MRHSKFKKTKKILATVSAVSLSILLCISPYTPSQAYAATSSDTSTEAVLSKGNFGTLKKINNTYYLVDEFGNIIDTVDSTSPGINLDRYLNKKILVKGNLFAGLLDSRYKENNSFLNRLRAYLSGIVVATPKIVEPDIKPSDEPEPPNPRPEYGVEPPPTIEPIEPPITVHPLYGVETPIEPIITVHPLYGVETPIEPKGEPIDPDLIEKYTIIEEQISGREELNIKGINIVPEMEKKQMPFQDGNGKE